MHVLREIGRVLGPVALGWIAVLVLAVVGIAMVMTSPALSIVVFLALGWAMMKLFGGGGYNSP